MQLSLIKPDFSLFVCSSLANQPFHSKSLNSYFNPEYAFDHLLLPCNLNKAIVQLLRSKMPVKLGVNSVSLTGHKDSLCLARETANFFGLLALMTKFRCIIRDKKIPGLAGDFSVYKKGTFTTFALMSFSRISM